MARRVFFSFHYERDITRANVVRNSWVGRDREDCGFWDSSLWEKSKLEGDTALKLLINGGLENTSVTALLIGRETASRRWVRYEIVKSFERGNGLLGVYIHGIRDLNGWADVSGANPFDALYYQVDDSRKKIFLYEWTATGWTLFKDVPEIPITNIQYIFSAPMPSAGQLSQLFPMYDWVTNSGYRNFGTWVESAARVARR